jgi:hypothetical protein
MREGWDQLTSPRRLIFRRTLPGVGVLFGLLLALAVGCVVLDTRRDKRSWQLVAAGLGFVALAFASLIATATTPWAGLAGLGVVAFVGRFLHTSRPRRIAIPVPPEVAVTPEPASNVRLL